MHASETPPMARKQTPKHASDPASSPISALPVALLARVLQHVPQQQRLACCALVSRDWAAAATAGTLSVECKTVDSSTCQSVGAWLKKYGRQLESLQLRQRERTLSSDPESPQLQLPCSGLQQLTSLQLYGLRVRLPASDSSTILTTRGSSNSAPSQHMPKLQDLRIESCSFDSAPTLLQLGPFTGVTQLKLKSYGLVSPEDSGLPAAHQAPEARRLAASTAALGLLQHMQLLQRLHLALWMEGEMWAAAALPSSITALTLDFSPFSEVSLPRSLQQLGGLKELRLQNGECCPDALASLSQLLVLELQECRLLPDVAGVDGTSVLLAAVGGMQWLRHLVILDGRALTSAVPSSCAALTASSHLTHLDIANAFDQPLPEGAVQHMFPAGRSMPQLQDLSLSCMFPDGNDEPFMTGAELAGIISVCPALTSLDITGALLPGSSSAISALLQLPPTCRQLSIGGEAFGDRAAGTVAQLTQLTKLEWGGSCSLTDAGLYQLTALQGLQELHLHDNHELSEGVVYKEDGFMHGQQQLLAGDMPVWRQLRFRIRTFTNAFAWIELLDQQQQENERLQHASTQQQQEIELLQRANAQLQQELQRLQQRCMSAPAAPAAAQLRRSARLGGRPTAKARPSH